MEKVNGKRFRIRQGPLLMNIMGTIKGIRNVDMENLNGPQAMCIKVIIMMMRGMAMEK